MTALLKARLRTPFIWLLAGLLGSGVGALLSPAVSYVQRQYQEPIVQHLSVDPPVNREVEPGGYLRVTLRYRKTADCPGTWSYFARWNGEDSWSLMATGAAGANPVGMYGFAHAIRIPERSPPGPAQWREVVSLACADGRETISRSPEVHFIVRPASE